MDPELTPEERDWLEQLDTDALLKPDPPPHVKESLKTKGLAIDLVEGGMQLTNLGRERLKGTIAPPAPPPWNAD